MDNELMVALIPLFVAGGVVISIALGLWVWRSSAIARRARSAFSSFAISHPTSLVFLTVAARFSQGPLNSSRAEADVVRGRYVRMAKIDGRALTLFGFNHEFLVLGVFEMAAETASVEQVHVDGVTYNGISLWLIDRQNDQLIMLAPDRLDRFCSPSLTSLQDLAESIRAGQETGR